MPRLKVIVGALLLPVGFIWSFMCAMHLRTRLADRANARAVSREWSMKTTAHGPPSACHNANRIYSWRNVGWGSNINQILLFWLGGKLRGEKDLALDLTQDFLQLVTCPHATVEDGQDLVGWRCMFKPIQHLCAFGSDSALKEHHVTETMAEIDIHEAPVLPSPDKLDIAMASSVLLESIYANLQPWFQEDIAEVLREERIRPIRSGRFIAIHVRRGDKMRTEATKVEVPVYLSAALQHLEISSRDRSGVDSVAGIWVSSDDSSVLPEVRELATDFFPNVRMENIVTISFGDNGSDNRKEKYLQVPTRARGMTYQLYTGLHAEFTMMSEANVFVGTFSSNIGRLVYLMREWNGLPRNSTISVDVPDWWLH